MFLLLSTSKSFLSLLYSNLWLYSFTISKSILPHLFHVVKPSLSIFFQSCLLTTSFSLCYNTVMTMQVIDSQDVPVRTLQEELYEITATIERRFLLYRIAGLSVKDSLGFCKVGMGSYNAWTEKPAFLAVNRRRNELERDHRAEAIKLLRRENQIGAVVVEERIINTLLEELDNKEYVLIKTPIAKTVYDKLMADIDAMATINVKAKMTFIDKMAMLMNGGTDVSKAEDSQPAQSPQSQPYQITEKGHNKVKEANAEERFITYSSLDGVVVEGEVVEGQVVEAVFKEIPS